MITNATENDMKEIIQQVERYVQDVLSENDASHDWLHIERVRKNAIDILHEMSSLDSMKPWLTMQIQELESNNSNGKVVINGSNTHVNPIVVELSALLHDIADFKYTGSDSANHDEAQKVLNLVKCPLEIANRVLTIVDRVSYRKEMGDPGYFQRLLSNSHEESQRSLATELAIVQDADRMDAIGAIGVARCFSYGAVRGHPFYSLNSPPNQSMSKEEYDKQTTGNLGNPIHHFYEKLFHIKDKMKTTSGQNVANQRHEFMLQFIRQFEKEVGLRSFDIETTR